MRQHKEFMKKKVEEKQQKKFYTYNGLLNAKVVVARCGSIYKDEFGVEKHFMGSEASNCTH